MKTKSLLSLKTQLAFGSAILTLLVVGAISYRGMAVSGESDRWVRHTHEVLEKLQDMLSARQSIVSSYRAFLLTGKDSYLDSYRASKMSAESAEAAVHTLTSDNPAQQRQFPALDDLAAKQIERAEMVIGLRSTRGMEAAAEVIQNGEGQRVLDEYQAIVGEMQNEEMRLLAIREADARERLGETKFILIFGTLLGVLVAAGAGWSALRDNLRRGRTEAELRDSEEKYGMLLDGVQDYGIFLLDQRGMVASWCAGAERITGFTAGEILGKHISSFFAPEDIQRGRPEEVLLLAIKNGRYEEQSTRVRKNGERFLANVSYTALRDRGGNLRGFSEISRDLSESKESEARYRGLLEAAPDAIVVVNQTGEIVLLNLQAEKQFGYFRDELIGQKVTNIIPEGFAERLIADDLRTTEAALAQVMGTGIELIARRKDRSNFPIEIMLSPLKSAGGILVTAAVRDISVRKAAEKHLAQMEGRYRGLLEAAPDAMVVVNKGGEIVLLNVQAEKQFGYRRDELLGQKVTNIIPEGFAERLIADDLRTTEAALAQVIGTGIELIAKRKDGSNFPIEIMLSPLESDAGILVTAAVRDISVRKVAEKHLAQMEGRYRGLLEAAPDAMVVVNTRSEIVLLNVQAEKQFGYRRDELIGQQVKNIIPEGFAERLVSDALRSAEVAQAQQIGTGIELIAKRKNGSDFPVEIMLSPLESDEGILVTVAIRDITKRKKADTDLLEKIEELNTSNKELVQFASIASHDLQEPLRMVASYTQLLAKRYKGRLDSDADEFIAYAVDGAARMQRLIRDLLTYSRVGTKGRELIDISAEDALNTALMNLRAAIEESGAVVTHDALPRVVADDMQLAQLFQNLVGNAIKYQSPGTPRVHISAVRNGDKKWTFSVRDNGLGIDSQYFEKIFGMFQRLHRREEFAGTGIGLAICKKIVERHGGNISVESEVGKGSTFRFALAGSESKS
jgi:PAS domain S-box-containing protein